MRESIPEVQKSYRLLIASLRAEYQDILQRQPRSTPRHYRLQVQLRDELRPVQAKLRTLVPLYRSLRALGQQTGEGTKAEIQYEKRAHALQSAIAELAGGRVSWAHCLLRDHPDLLVWVPTKGRSPVLWPMVSLQDLLVKAKAERLEFEANVRRRAAVAADDRKALLSSFTPAQWALVKTALATARTSGRNAIMIDERDIP